jgi:hypothetical protein
LKIEKIERRLFVIRRLHSHQDWLRFAKRRTSPKLRHKNRRFASPARDLPQPIHHRAPPMLTRIGFVSQKGRPSPKWRHKKRRFASSARPAAADPSSSATHPTRIGFVLSKGPFHQNGATKTDDLRHPRASGRSRSIIGRHPSGKYRHSEIGYNSRLDARIGFVSQKRRPFTKAAPQKPAICVTCTIHHRGVVHPRIGFVLPKKRPHQNGVHKKRRFASPGWSPLKPHRDILQQAYGVIQK